MNSAYDTPRAEDLPTEYITLDPAIAASFDAVHNRDPAKEHANRIRFADARIAALESVIAHTQSQLRIAKTHRAYLDEIGPK